MDEKNCIHCKNQPICSGYGLAYELVAFLAKQELQKMHRTAIMETTANECKKFEQCED